MTTAAIPAFLLWGLKMKRKTKSILHTIFLLGLVTAGLSIGRAVTTKNSTWAVDMTWNSTVNGSFSFTEEKIGIVLASCPMIRQGIVYAFRHKTLCPTSRRIPPNDDFVAMRKRIKLRDIFWYRQTEPRELLPPQPLSAEKPRDISPRDQEVKKSGLDHVWRNFVQIFRLDRRVPDVEQDGQNGVNGVVVERKDMITETEGGSEDDASEGRTAKKAGDSETFLLSRTNASAMEWPLTTSSAKGSPLASGGRSFA
ncbi:MAG: hypothetical protein M1831_000141 [Alyxoria varia]|nr:MAG: hypothetical protein M1831_000141 [Alyxoria varia]